MTVPPSELTPLAPGAQAGEFTVLTLTRQYALAGHAVQHYEVRDGRSGGQLHLRRVLPPPPQARAEAQWLSALGLQEQRGSAFPDVRAAWSDAEAAFLVSRERRGQSLQAYLATHPPLSAADGEVLARGLLTALAALHAGGLTVLELSAAQVWLGTGGEVGFTDLWAALGPAEGAAGSRAEARMGDLRRVGDILRGAVQPAPGDSGLGQLLTQLARPDGGTVRTAAGALHLLDGVPLPPSSPCLLYTSPSPRD